MFFEKMIVMCVFAHPDDSEISCAGTLAKLSQQGSKIFVLQMTKGEKSSSNKSDQRVKESQSASRLIGYTLLQESLPDGMVTNDIGLISLIEKHMFDISPDIVITHYPQPLGDGHQDHYSVALATVNVAQRCSFVKWVLYSEPTFQSMNFVPNLFVDVTELIELKRKAIRLHKSERHKPYTQKKIVDLKARWWALQASFSSVENNRFFEAFKIVKGIILS